MPHHRWRRVLVYTHRWLGIAGAALFVAWFASGVVMMYARMPVLSPAERLSRLPALDLSRAAVHPAAAAARAGVVPDRVSIGMIGRRPVYRFFDRRGWTTSYADTGERLQGLTAAEAVRLVTGAVPEHASTVRHDARLTDADQWSMGVRALMPMHRVALGDPDDSYLYVSERTGDLVLKTTSRERMWAYPGAILHWLYFAPLRRQSGLWTQTIIWTSIAGCLLCLHSLDFPFLYDRRPLWDAVVIALSLGGIALSVTTVAPAWRRLRRLGRRRLSGLGFLVFGRWS